MSADGSTIDTSRGGAMEPAPMTEAEERFAERLAVDLEPILGAAIAIGRVEIHGDGPVAVVVACVVDGRDRTIEVEADDLLEAYRRTVTSAAELRLTAAWSEVVEHP